MMENVIVHVKVEPAYEDACVENEVSSADVSDKVEPLLPCVPVKTEPGVCSVEPSGSFSYVKEELVCVKDEPSEDVFVKEPPLAEARGASMVAAAVGLWTGHTMEVEFELGPKAVKPHPVHCGSQGQPQKKENGKANEGHCSYTTGDKDSLEHPRILAAIKNEKQGKCQQSNYASTCKRDLLSHERWLKNLGEKPYQCTECSFTTTAKRYLVKHGKKHMSDKPHKCSQCTYSSAIRSNLIIHERKHTGEKPFQCDHCSYQTTTKRCLVNHIKRHIGNRPYSCSQCSYSCVDRSNLIVHERKHTGHKPYKCSQCIYASTHQSNLKVHERTHTGVKPFRCQWCRYTCTEKCKLIIHESTHTGVKRYKCGWCSYASSEKCKLTIHERKHTGDKPFKCSLCDYATTERFILTIHEKTHTSEDPYRCEHCTYASYNIRNFRAHVRKQHRVLKNNTQHQPQPTIINPAAPCARGRPRR